MYRDLILSSAPQPIHLSLPFDAGYLGDSTRDQPSLGNGPLVYSVGQSSPSSARRTNRLSVEDYSWDVRETETGWSAYGLFRANNNNNNNNNNREFIEHF